jgi:hypothetical protein
LSDVGTHDLERRLVLPDLHDGHDPVVDVDVVARHRQRLHVTDDLLGGLARRREDVHLGRYGVRARHDAGGSNPGDLTQRILELRQQAQCGHPVGLSI